MENYLYFSKKNYSIENLIFTRNFFKRNTYFFCCLHITKAIVALHKQSWAFNYSLLQDKIIYEVKN